MGGLLHLVQRGGDWAAPQQPAQAFLAVQMQQLTHQLPAVGYTHCCIMVRCFAVGFNVPIKGLN